MKFGILSDIHGDMPIKKDRKELATCDIVCLCGDVFEGTSMDDFANWQIVEWMKSLTDTGKRVIMTPGNHDIMLYKGWLKKNNLPIDEYCRHIWKAYPLTTEELKEKCRCEVLIDEGTEVEGIKIYSTPWCPLFYNWSFMKDEKELFEIFSKIPSDTNVLLTHTPPKKDSKDWDIDVSDYDRNVHCGSDSLYKAIDERLTGAGIYCGHIHSGSHKQGSFFIPNDNFVVNVSYVNENYKPYYEPYYFEV